MPGVRFTENQSTNLATLYGRALDARADKPLLGDPTAEDIVRRIDYDFGKFKVSKNDAFGIAARGKVFDDLVRDFIRRHPECTVVHLGVGMDSRVYRIDPPATVRWFDIDFPDVIDLRRQLYPERDNTTMIGSSVTDDWTGTVPGDRNTLVVAEGLTMYLDPADGLEMFRRVVEHFPSGEVFFDAYSKRGVKLQKTNAIVRRAKATLSWGIDDPSELAEAGLAPISVQTAEAFLPEEAWERLSPVPRALYRAVLRIPLLRNMGKLMHFRFGA